MRPFDVLAAARRTGVRLEPTPQGLRVDLPAAAADWLLPEIREAKPELLRVLAATGQRDACPACGTAAYRWEDADCRWHCGRCEPDPRAELWAGVVAGDLGGRCPHFEASAGRPAIREWVRTAAGWASVMAYGAGGAECFVRLLRPQAGRRPFLWVPTEELRSEVAAGEFASDGPPRRREEARQ